MKYCSHCGTQSQDNDRFCSNCGYKFPEQQAGAPEDRSRAEGYSNPIPPQYQHSANPAATSDKNKAIASMVLGIVSVIFCWAGWLSFIAIAISIFAIVLGVQARNTIPVGSEGRNMATAGLVMGIVGVSFSSIIFISCLSCYTCWYI